MPTRSKAARFPQAKTLDEFDFSQQPSINKPLVLELAKGQYIDDRENVLLIGSSGVIQPDGTCHIDIGRSSIKAMGCVSAQRWFSDADMIPVARHILEKLDEDTFRFVRPGFPGLSTGPRRPLAGEQAT